MAGFTGNLILKVNHANNLEPTAYIKRLPGINVTTLDPYMEINIDDRIIGKSGTKPKTLSPEWNEEFREQV